MTVTLLDGASAAAAPRPQAPAASSKPATTQAADIPSARVAARLSGKRVEALSERTETSTTWANKDGSLTTELTAGPVRFQDDTAAGGWRDVDLDLVSHTDGVEPKAHPRGLKLAGRTGAPAASLKAAQASKGVDLVTLGEGDEQITLQWKGGLPAPKLDGTRAEYVNAVPGADVVVEATRTGFEQFVEIKQKPVSEGYTYTLPLKAKGLKVEQQADGSVLFTDRKSKKQAVMPAPVMWDATVDKVSGEHTHRARVAMKVVKTKGGVDLVITPDATFLADPATKYPVTVDPSTSSLGNVFDTYVQQGETVDWSTDTELDLGNPGTVNGNGTPRTARSFITWNTEPIRDALVTDAKLSLWNFHSGNTDCQAYPWEVWSTGAASTSSRWTAQPAWTAKKATSTETRGNPACTSAPDGWINADVTALTQEWASAKATRGHMGLRASSETVTAQWKRVNSANAASNPPKLVVTYNYRPRTGTKQEAGPPYFSYGGEYVVNTLTPTLRDTFVDADGDKVNGTFQIYDSATDTQVGNVIVSPYVPSGQVASVTVPAGVLTNGKTYKFRTSPYDGAHYNLGWSAWKTFTVDTTKPTAPAKVTSADYPTGTWAKGAGQAGTFTVTPPASDHNWLEWSLDGVTWTKVATGGATGDKGISVTPSDNGSQSLLVRAVDKADNRSTVVEYTFNVGPGGFLRPAANERTARRLTLEAESDAAKYDAVSFSWRRSAADNWVTIPVGDVTEGGSPLSAWPVAMTSGKSAALVWNASGTVTPDGSVEIKADFTGPGGAVGSTDPLTVVVDRNADDAASEEVGPGSVNLLTGDYTIDQEDASFFGLSVARTASSRSPDAGAQQEDQAPIYGPQWVSGFAAEISESDYTHLEKISDTAVSVVLADDSPIHFTANAAKTGWVPEPGAEEMTLKGSVSGTFTLSDSEGTVTEFTRASPTSSAWQVSSTLVNGLANSATAVVSENVTVDGKLLARPKRVIAPTSAATAAACEADPATKGCRLLEYVYASTTTATASAFGDFSGQVKEIRLWATAPGATSATSKSVQMYQYDNSGRLRRAWNPQISPSLITDYAYDSAGRVTGLTTPGELPWAFTYGKAGNDPAAGDGMLLKAGRPGLKQGSADVTEGVANTSVVYDVPLAGASAPYAMGVSDVGAWGQLDAPADAAALFPADTAPTSHSGGDLAPADYKRATIHYLNTSGQRTNTAAPGGRIDSTDYDRFSNVVRSLSAGNRETALGTSAADRAALAELGISDLPSAERAELLSTRSVYNDTGTRELEQFGPLGRIDLARDLKSGTTTLVAAGSPVIARSWTIKAYDEGRPSGDTAAASDQVTSTTEGAQVREHPGVMGDAQVIKVEYDWAKGLATKVVQDPAGLAITTTTEYDSQGRVVKQGAPGTSGTDAGTQTATYWSATGTGACAGRPEWADLLCSTGPAGDITGGGSNPAQLPTMTVEYDRWGNTAKTSETVGGTTRTITRSYDAAGRATTVQITGGLGQTVPTATTEYDPVSGQQTKTTSPTGGTITRAYDKLGREISYTDADGGVTTTEYDLLDRPVRTSNNIPSSTTYTYDASIEARGLPTKVTDSVAGEFSTTYDPDGTIATEKLPGGYTLKQTKDSTGAVVERVYTRNSDETIVYSDTVTQTIHGQDASHSGWSDQKYGYDNAGRLTRVEDTVDTVCTLRGYTVDKRSNRTAVSTASAAPGLACPTAEGTATTRAYDTADRIVGGGYSYDGFGRTTALPGSTVSYYANDLAHQQTAGTKRQTWQLDAGLRFRSWTIETSSSGTWSQTEAKTNHYSGDSDNPSWIVENAAGSTLTRNVTTATGALTATTGKTSGTVLQLTNIHGDVALQLPLDTAVAPTALDTDENGATRAGQAAQRYGWLGGKQRSSETLTGLTLMGVRLYDPNTARFLQTDPVFGGNCNAYDYVCADPVNGTDLDGRCGAWGNPFKKCDKWRILMWSRGMNSYWRTIREGSTSNVRENGVKYGKFGLAHIKSKHVGYGKKSNWLTSSGMISDLKKALLYGKWKVDWEHGWNNTAWKITYSYKTGCGCRKKKKWTVTAFYRNIPAPDGKPLGVTTAYKNRTG
ncbi:RHS repeat-associated core domain-containing protein [Streptomyces tirandamycinicus]|uniref:RHS repeat-associated core domain-containing protein n=1 Tax=Streptomyces tirandamycinicus TaxID=2174846 RepID=UPI003CC576A3